MFPYMQWCVDVRYASIVQTCTMVCMVSHRRGSISKDTQDRVCSDFFYRDRVPARNMLETLRAEIA